MATTMTPGEEAQLTQTIEMFEVITQTQPHDYQSLEILKEAYSKLGREKDVISTRQAHCRGLRAGGAVLLRHPGIRNHPPIRAQRPRGAGRAQTDREQGQLRQPARADGHGHFPQSGRKRRGFIRKPASRAGGAVDDGRKQMQKIFVESKLIAPADFDLCWRTVDPFESPPDVVEPFLQALADKNLMPAEAALKLLSDRTRVAYLPLERYDLDIELARSFPADTCRRWCVLPIDVMSKSIMVATANPFNQQAAKELAEATNNRLLWASRRRPNWSKTSAKFFVKPCLL